MHIDGMDREVVIGFVVVNTLTGAAARAVTGVFQLAVGKLCYTALLTYRV